MSDTGKGHGSPNAPKTPAAGVMFTTIDSSNIGESSSRPESWSSIGKRSSTSDRLSGDQHDHALTAFNGDIQNAIGNVARKAKKRGGFLLDSVAATGRSRSPDSSKSRGKRGEANGHLHIDNRLSSHRFSGESSQRGSPLSREMSLDGTTKHEDERQDFSTHPPAMDPAQLVQMALNLSESRKRNVTSAFKVQASPPSKKMSTLGTNTMYANARNARPGSRAANSQKSQSPDLRKTKSTDQMKDQPEMVEDSTVYSFSPATLSRAEKARRYFELASEHRRLLEHLPPLRPIATVPGSHNSSMRNSPASVRNDRTSQAPLDALKQSLGRAYNPLQALRNRRLRNRERRPLTAPPDTWQETDRIKHWIDNVAAGCNDPDYLSSEDQVRLPQFEGESDGVQLRPATGKGHNRSNTVSSVVTRSENGWTIEPAELLADTYWIEKGDNKTIIEDREGHRIFPTRKKSVIASSRRSKEFDAHTDEPSNQIHEFEDDGDKRRARKHVLHLPDRLRRPHLSRTVSTTSNTSDEGRRPSHLQFGMFRGAEGDENIGPLERHMREMIAKDERGELFSPELVSPDHWDSKRTHFPTAREHVGRVKLDSVYAKNRMSIGSHRHRRPRSEEEDLASFDHGMSSMDDMVLDSPTSPRIPGFAPSTDIEVSSPSSKYASPTEGQNGKGRSPVIRSQSKDRAHIGQADFAGQIGTPLSPVLSGDDSLPFVSSRLSTDVSRPNHKRNLTAESSEWRSLHRLNTSTSTNFAPSVASASASASAGRRFFKGGRIGELVRNESSRFGDRFRNNREKGSGILSSASDISRNVSENSDTDDELAHYKQADKNVASKDVSPRTSLDGQPAPKPRYYISNLPSFKSPAAREHRTAATSPSVEIDPISRQQRMQRVRGHSPRFDRLAPPRIRLPDDDAVSDPELRAQDSNAYLRPGPPYGGSVSARNSISDLHSTPGAFDSIVPQGRRFATGGLPEGKRHWSISDQRPQAESAHQRVSARDIARVRTLLLVSGIKAREILEKANGVRESPSPMLREVTAATGKPESSISRVSRKEEHVLAARMLSEILGARVASLRTSIDTFNSRAAADLMEQLAQLQNRAANQLTSLVHETSDDADAFNVELTTKQPQDVKRVDDAVDAMFRQRRRQFRWLRRAGFKILEWLVLGIMWWVWFVVVIINIVRKIVVGLGKSVRWLIWF